MGKELILSLNCLYENIYVASTSKLITMKNKIVPVVGLVVLIGLLFGFQQKTSKENVQIKKGMIKVTILYPNADGKTFDMDYYANKHMPMLASLLGDSLKLLEIDKGLSGRTPNDPIPYLAIGHLYFDRLSAWQNSFKPNAEKILKDVPNYTNIQPVVQISEVIQ
jgi:uncharacterized protein (TIGR02118 family)